MDTNASGVALTQLKSLASDTQYRVDFDGVSIAASDRVGAAQSGWQTWNGVMHDCIILVSALAAGGAARALDLTIEYAKERHQFDKPLAAFQAISHYLADAATNIEGGSTLVHEAAWAAAEGKDTTKLAPMAKLFMCHTYRDVLQEHAGLRLNLPPLGHSEFIHSGLVALPSAASARLQYMSWPAVLRSKKVTNQARVTSGGPARPST